MSDTLYEILRFVIVGASETWYVHFSLSTLLKKKKDININLYLLALAIYCACTVFDAANNFKIYFVFMFAYSLIAVVAYFFYEGAIGIKLGIAFVCIALNYACTIFAQIITVMIKKEDVTFVPKNLTMGIDAQVLLIILCILFVYLFAFICKNLTTNFKSVFLVTFIIPLILFILILVQYYMNQELQFKGDLLKGYLIIAALLILSAEMLYALTMLNNSLVSALTYSATLQQMISMQAKYYDDIQKHQLELRKINHDIKNHTRTISNLLDSGRYEEAKDYTNTIIDSVNTIASPVTNCDNQIINALLNDKLGSVKERGVELSLCVMVPQTFNIDNVDICIILGNLLDNAVEACNKMSLEENKFIKIDIRLVGVFLSIEVSNSYTEPINFSKSKYLSTKIDKLYHGIGLSNVRQVVDKYDGKLIIDHEKNIFNVSILIPYPEEASSLGE